MSRYGVRDPKTNEWNDIVWRRYGNQGWSVETDKKLGIVFGPSKYDGWRALAITPERMMVVPGFRTRWMATQFILQARGLWPWSGSEEWDPEIEEWFSPTKRDLDRLLKVKEKKLDVVL